MTTEIRVGDILTMPEQNQSFRVIYIDNNVIVTCLLDVPKLDIRNYSVSLIVEEIARGSVTHERDKHVVIDLQELSDSERQDFLMKREICHKITALYGPTFEALVSKVRKPELRQIELEYNIKKTTLRHIYIQYIQSGLDDMVLLDKRSSRVGELKKSPYKYDKKRPGRTADDEFSSRVIVDDTIQKQFDEAIKERLSGRCKTYDSAYSWLVSKYYSESYVQDGSLVIGQQSEIKIPSKRQFTYYARKKVSQQAIDIVKTSKQEVRNDKRLLLSDTYNDALGPGDLVEIDAVEVDVALVSSHDRKQAIGRPILYLMIDVFTRMIIAMTVSLHNNAVLALTNLFLNLSDDKKEYCAKYGHFINDTAWVSNIIPRRIRVDRGSDFKSDPFGKICEELGIDRQLVPGATGSLKGNIEQEFRTLHAAQKPHLDGKGVISQRHDSNHHKEAVLTIEEYTKMAVDFVLHHNTMACSNYPLTADMIKNGVHAVPYELWQYGSQKYGMPRPITNLDMFRYTLMEPVKASIDRSGIVSNELYYINTTDQALLDKMYALQNKRESFEARIDPRDVTNLYYLKNGQLMIAGLNPLKTANDGFEGMTLFEYKAFLKEKRKLVKEGEIRTQRAKNSLFAAQDAIVNEAMSMNTSGYANTKGIRDARSQEKQRVANENKIASRIVKEKPVLQEVKEPTIEHTSESALIEEKEPKTVKDDNSSKGSDAFMDFSKAMDLFEED